MTKPKITKEKRTCKNPACRKEYEAEVVHLLNTNLIRGDGFCPECAKKEYETIEAKEQAKSLEAINHQRLEWRKTCGIPLKFMNEDFSTFKDKRPDMETNLEKAYKMCWEYAEKYPISDPWGYHSLLLFSDHSWGVGKTHLASAIPHRILDQWNGERFVCPVRFISEPDIYTMIQATYNYSQEEKQYRQSEADIIKELTRVPLLVIDDIGKRRVQDPRFVQRTMFSIIDGRYKALLPMVLTANLSPERLAEYLGGGQLKDKRFSDKPGIEDMASFDRLMEMCRGRFLRIDGKSYRGERR